MDDVKQKPLILHSLICDHLPNEYHPLPDHIDVHKIVNAIKTFGLLSESFPQEANSKLVEDWAGCIDAWVNRLLSLVSSPRAKKCWLGICLLGVTCQECGSNRFLVSYSLWLDKLLSNIQPASDYISVKVASCASISDLLLRLSRYSNAKKDGILHAGRLIQPVLELLSEDSSEAVSEAAVGLLCKIINFFPASIQHYYNSVESIIVSKIVSARCSSHTLEMYAHCLALLPKSRGDEDSWILMMQDLLTSTNIHLNDIFQGLEQETKCNEDTGLSIPPGRDPSAPIGGWTMTGQATYLEARRSKKLIVSIVPTLMLCCCTMLTNPYPVQVTVPVQQLLTLIRRVLRVNGSLSQVSSPFTVMQQEFVCSELPILHSYSIDLLDAIIKGAQSQLLPYGAHIIRLLKEYFGRCTLPALRIKVYSVIRTLLMSMGVGIALYISKEVISNASVDLDFAKFGSGKELFGTEYKSSTTKALLQPVHKKRKVINTDDSFGKQQDGQCAEVAVPMKNSTSPTSLKIAALEALETVLTVGGAFKSGNMRANVDLLLINVAKNAYDGKWASEEESDFVPFSEPARAELQLAALRALLASLLSQTRLCPHYLSQGLELFHKGKQEIGTKLAEFCAHALLALEVVMHPRIINPLAGIPSENEGSINDELKQEMLVNVYLRGLENNAPISTSMGMDNPYPDDDLYDSWLGSGSESEATTSNPNEAIKGYEANHLPISDVKIPVKVKEGLAGMVNAEMGRNVDEIMHKTQQFLDPMSFEDLKAFTGTCTASEVEFKKNILESSEFGPACLDVKLSKDMFTIAEDDKKEGKNTSVAMPGFNEAKGSVSGLVDESSEDFGSDNVDEGSNVESAANSDH